MYLLSHIYIEYQNMECKLQSYEWALGYMLAYMQYLYDGLCNPCVTVYLTDPSVKLQHQEQVILEIFQAWGRPSKQNYIYSEAQCKRRTLLSFSQKLISQLCWPLFAEVFGCVGFLLDKCTFYNHILLSTVFPKSKGQKNYIFQKIWIWNMNRKRLLVGDKYIYTINFCQVNLILHLIKNYSPETENFHF